MLHTHVYSERKTSSVTSEVKPIGVSWNGKPPGGTGITWRQTFQKHHARAATPKPSQTIPKTLPRSLETTLTVTQLSRTTWNHAHMGWNLSAAYCWHLLWSFWSTRKECQEVLYFGHGNFAVAAKLPRILVFWDFSLTFSSATVVWKHFFGHHWQAWQWTTCFFRRNIVT